MKPRYSSIIVITVLLVSGIFTLFTSKISHAQALPVTIQALQVSASPENPAPGDSVKISVISYAIDINSATITWSVNGKVTSKGVGLTSITVTSPKLGKVMDIQVSAVTPQGQQHSQTFFLKSGDIDFIIESSGYVPPFFLGKMPVVYQNTVRVVALPHLANSSGVEYDPASLVYKWEKGTGAVLQSQSGFGKNYIDMTSSLIPRPYSLTVTATTKDGAASTKSSVSVNPQSPKLAFYINDQLYGPLYNEAIGGKMRLGSQKELSVIAVPYGFDKMLNGVNILTYNWLINNDSSSDLSSNDIIVMRTPDNTSGTSNISLAIESPKYILENANGGFSVTFNNTVATSSSSQTATF